MARRDPRPARFSRRYARHVDADLAELAVMEPELLDAAVAAVDDLTHGRQRGKLLGDRHVTGDPSGLLRLRFDLPGQRPSRFRIVCRLAEHNTMIEVLAIGERAEHAVYRDVLTRLDDPDQNSDGEP